MLLHELKDKIDKLAIAGYNNAEVYFDTEGGAFTYHIAKVSSANIVPRELIGTDHDSFILTTHDPIIHRWKDGETNE